MLVNFLIVGTQKGGTTALAQFLSNHPQICIAPAKEVHFFDYDQNYQTTHPTWLGVPPHLLPPVKHLRNNLGTKPRHSAQMLNPSDPSDIPDICDIPNPQPPTPTDRYHSFFPNYTNQPAVGEATPIYMYFPWIADRIKAYNPNMKLIVLLRHPVERAYSHYQMERARGWEWLPFPLAIRFEALRLRIAKIAEKYDKPERSGLRTHSYSDRGFYARQIHHLLRYFPREQMLVLLNEDLQKHHHQTLKRVYQFLNVDSNIIPPEPERVLSGNYQPMSQRDRNYLLRLYDREVDTLAKFLELDLSDWKT
ncbi:sulfotransferase domain-containing protein [Pseudanabaena sp. PCC 6802]|uniref:sulfotransferase domain-containing protein n=1 Tax=Pseudanabaena sp. PCC 6802 TaxID=118173 RepID=UPI0003461E42|nr:sulfotransferase domain-containing protein [Pseudanabaena sp. PCC 6802]